MCIKLKPITVTATNAVKNRNDNHQQFYVQPFYYVKFENYDSYFLNKFLQSGPEKI